MKDEPLKTLSDYKMALQRAKIKIWEMSGEINNLKAANKAYKELYEGKKK